MDLFNVYKRWDIEPVKGLGSTLWDAAGQEYLDLYGGHAVISIGHSHPHYVAAIKDQIGKLGFYSNAVQNGLQDALAEKLGKVSGYDSFHLFLCNSGAEANENALKLASFHTGRSKVLAFGGAFHGRTSGAVSVTDNPKIRAPFNATDKVTFVPLGDLAATEKELSTKEYAVVIIEGIQGVAGIQLPSDAFLRDLRALCDRTGTLLLLDEIQSGCGRTGRFFAHQWAGIEADLVTMAKGLAGGIPIGAVLISPKIEASYGLLGTTFGGNHIACAAAIAVLEVIEGEGLVAHAEKLGNWFEAQLKGDSALKEYRGRGLMIGLEIKPEYKGLRDRLLFEKHIFTGASGADVIRLLPALNLPEEGAAQFVEAWKALTK
ncbi:MAG: aspartate aminotransferase family protein [Bacteroidales bacterium]|nr:aspartate aminotransferase family protein [Bacteroidales bacterium]MBR3097071.1 aspartate aminotransferase family protein [Bacteroidales bacterium]MBR4687628.1 aspartate aminotransferase family protein [Bacteroidales bacterium]